MDNSERILRQLDKMDGKLDDQTKVSRENKEGIKLINQSLQGNGGKGLFKRMDERESWEKEHEQKIEEKTRLSREEIRVQRAREAVIMASVIGGIVAIITTLITVLL